MTNSSFLKRTIFALFAVSAALFVSCDDDFNILGADVVGGDIHSDLIPQEIDVVAYDRAMGAVQSNNALQNQLGVYESAVFGKTVSNFVTQVAMASENPTIYDPQIDSVYLYVPYYAKKTGTAEDGKGTYEWGDFYNNYIFGNPDEAKFDLKVYRNGYYLKSSDPSATDNIQRYFSDDRQMVENLKMDILVDSVNFSFKPTEVTINAKVTHTDGTVTDKVVERKEPGIFASLDTIQMKEIFFSEANRSNLVNNTIFKDYFRGLYFKIEEKSGSAMAIPRFSEGTITFKYHDYDTRTDGTPGPDINKGRVRKTMTLNLKGNTVNFFDNTYNPTYTSEINSSNASAGDEKLYLNGGAGSMAIIELNAQQIKAFQDKYAAGKDMLVNEANLVFYLDKAKMGTTKVAPRIYLYDLKNRKPIIDYMMDSSKDLLNSKGDKYIYGGILDTVNNKYTIRLTNHIKNIMKGDSTNVRLGLVVTDNISITTNYRLKTPFTEGSGETATEVKEVPYASIQSRFGTILYGNNVPAADKDKKVKLEIYYSKPKE
jgi:hypothetical protein